MWACQWRRWRNQKSSPGSQQSSEQCGTKGSASPCPLQIPGRRDLLIWLPRSFHSWQSWPPSQIQQHGRLQGDYLIEDWRVKCTWRAVLSTSTRGSFPFTASTAFLSSLDFKAWTFWWWEWRQGGHLSGLQISLSIASQSPLNFHRLRLSSRRRWGRPSVQRNCSASFSFASGLSLHSCCTFSKHCWYL